MSPRQTSDWSHAHNRRGYLGADFPERWPIVQTAVQLAYDESQHFRLEEQDGIVEWNTLVAGNGIVHLGSYMQPFTVALMHQLKCLDIVRGELVQNRTDGPYAPSNLGQHCLNYLRQIVMCHGSGTLESLQYMNHIDTVDKRVIYECKDWEAVRREVVNNQKLYKRLH